MKTSTLTNREAVYIKQIIKDELAILDKYKESAQNYISQPSGIESAEDVENQLKHRENKRPFLVNLFEKMDALEP